MFGSPSRYRSLSTRFRGSSSGGRYSSQTRQRSASELSASRNGQVYLDRLSGRERKEALRQMADRREAVFARRAANVAALSG